MPVLASIQSLHSFSDSHFTDSTIFKWIRTDREQRRPARKEGGRFLFISGLHLYSVKLQNAGGCVFRWYKDVFCGSYLFLRTARQRFSSNHAGAEMWTYYKMRKHIFTTFQSALFYFHWDISITEMDGADRRPQHTTTSNRCTCAPLLQSQLIAIILEHVLDKRKRTILWRQAKASAAAESATFSIEWDLGSLPALTTAHKYTV